jgi:transposase InsO family protein
MPVPLPEPTQAEAIALFRLGIVGDLLARDLAPGELRDELVARAAQRHRPPGATSSRSYHWKTLQSWYYAAKQGGHRRLVPASRRKGFATALSPEKRALLVQIRREHPSAAAGLILDVAVRQNIVAKDEVSPSTLRRLFAAAGVPRSSVTRTDRRERRRWDAGRVGALWHGDVCHIWVRSLAGVPRKLYVHGLLDDHSRYVPVIEAREAEKETDMLSILCAALLRFPTPETLYLDNGSCYRGETLALACARLGIHLVHAQPYDPQARGKMERFWRTLRQRCTDHLPPGVSIHDVNAALLAFLDGEYHARPHAGLMGEAPARRFHAGLGALGLARSAKDLAAALEVTVKRRIGNALTFSVEGRLYEVRGRHLAGKTVDVVVDPFTGAPLRVEFEASSIVFGLCDMAANRHRGRAAAAPSSEPTVPFDPIAALLEKARRDPS